MQCLIPPYCCTSILDNRVQRALCILCINHGTISVNIDLIIMISGSKAFFAGSHSLNKEFIAVRIIDCYYSRVQ